MSWHSRSSLGNIDPTREHERGRRRTRSQPRRSSTPSTTAATGYIITGEPVTASANEISPERRSYSPIIPALPEVDPYKGYPTVIPPTMTYSAPVFYPPQPATRDTYATVEPEGPEDRYHTRDPWSRRRSRSSQPSHRPRRDSADRLFGSGQGWPLGTPQVPAGAFGSTAHLPSRPAYMGHAYPDAARPAQYPFNPPPDFRFGQKSAVFGSDATSEILYFFLYTVPKEIYLIALFRLPQFYFSRVRKVFDDAELSKRDIHKIYQTTAREWRKSRDKKREEDLPPISWNVNANNGDIQITPAMMSFKASWEDFIDSLQREWSTLNLLSGLLLTAILTLLTLDGAPDDPVTRTASVISLICALMSILYACLYIARFGPMRQMYKAASWAEEARRTRTNIVWNVWALLAMPAVWLAWSLISFIVAIMSYVWRTNSESSPSPRTTSDGTALAIRIATTCVLGVGVLYFALVLRTFGQYGDAMDRQWEEDNDRRMRLLNGLRSSSYHLPDTEKHTYRPYPPYPPAPLPGDYPPFASPVIIHDSRMASTEDAGPLASGAQIRSSIDSRSSQQRRRRRLGGTTPERGSIAVDEQESGRLPRARSSRRRGSSEYYGRSHGRPTSSSAERSVRIASTPELVPDVKHSARQARGAAAYVDPLPFPLSTIQEESTVESSSSLGYHQRPLSRPIDREDQVLAWRPFRAYPLIDLDTLDSEDAGRNIRFVPRAPSAVYDRGLAASTWTYFIEDLKKAWFYRHSAEESRYHSPTATVLATLARWEYFFRRCYEITVVLVERTTETDLKRYRICVFDSQYDVTRAFDGYFEMNPSETDPKVVVLDGPPPWDEAFRRQRTFINPRTAQYASSTRRGREHPDPPSGGMHIQQSPTGFSYYEQTERPLSESPTERSPLFSGVESPRAGSSQHVIERRSSASSNPNTRTQSPALPAATPHVNLNMDDEQRRMQDSEAS